MSEKLNEEHRPNLMFQGQQRDWETGVVLQQESALRFVDAAIHVAGSDWVKWWFELLSVSPKSGAMDRPVGACYLDLY